MTRFFRVKKDANHEQIVRVFRQMHCSVVETLRTGVRGCPDLVVGFGGHSFLVEIKNPETSYGRRGLNPNQKDFIAEWHGSRIEQVSCVDDAVKLVRQWAHERSDKAS